jgi:hypothetical protein
MATTTKIIDMEKVCNNTHNITDQLVKLCNEFFTVNSSSSPSTIFGAPTASNSSSSSLLPDTAAPLLLATPCSD